MKKIVLNIGDVVVSNEPVVLETILGSCVAICLWDENLKVGGMNHFMFPRTIRDVKNPSYCGPESINMLVRDILKMGVNKYSLRAKLFGGGKVFEGISRHFDVGTENVKTAKDILQEHGIPIVNEFTGCDCGTKVVFYPDTGRAFVKKLAEGINGQSRMALT
jgi:chemotaxis protein CheD